MENRWDLPSKKKGYSRVRFSNKSQIYLIMIEIRAFCPNMFLIFLALFQPNGFHSVGLQSCAFNLEASVLQRWKSSALTTLPSSNPAGSEAPQEERTSEANVHPLLKHFPPKVPKVFLKSSPSIALVSCFAPLTLWAFNIYNYGTLPLIVAFSIQKN